MEAEFTEKRFNLPLWFSMGLLLVGLLFKIQHWTYANLMVSLSFLSIAIFYSLRFYFKVTTPLDYIKLGLILSWCMSGTLGINHFPYKEVFQTITTIFFLVWYFMEGPAYFKAGIRAPKSTISHIKSGLFRLGSLSILYGVIGAMLKLEGVTIALVAGLAFGAIWFILEMIYGNDA